MKTTTALLSWSLALGLGSIPLSLRANPLGETVTAGAATFDRTTPGSLSVYQGSDRAIINWQDFSIAAGETTRFLQPNVNSAVLNRVLGGNPSDIYGNLQANGQVFLLNPAGVLVGPGGQIDTHGFVASTLNLDDADFMHGAKLTLSGDSSASVKNQGNISSVDGDVFLVARSVSNAGTISAPKGEVNLTAATEVVLGDTKGGLGIIYGTGSVENSGIINAASADLRAAGGNVYALAINNTGVIRATSITSEGGKIVLKADSGTVTSTGSIAATGSTGGQVQILGDRVGLFDNAVVDASGDKGGGQILIGGDYQGKDNSIQNAIQTEVGPSAIVKADAVTSGDGGRVIVWSDQYTRFDGLLSAKGGTTGGNGGFTEVSGKQNLAFDGSLQLGAPAGHTGYALFDPTDIIIDTTSVDTVNLADVNNFSDTDLHAGSLTTINPSALNSSTANITLQATHDITFTSAVSLTQPGVGIAAQAGDNITVTAGITTIGGFVTLSANDAGGTASGSGHVIINGPIDTHAANGGNISITHNAGGTADQINASLTTLTGNVTISGNASVASGTPTISTSGGNVSFGGTLALTGSLTVDAGTVGNVAFLGSVTDPGNVALAVNHSAITALSGAVNVGGGSLTTVAATRTDVDADISSTTGNVTLDRAVISGHNIAASGAGVIMFNHPTSTDSGAVVVSSVGGNITFNSSLDLGIGSALTVNGGAAGNVTFTGAVTIGNNNLTVANALATTISSSISGVNGAVAITDQGVITVGGSGSIALTGTGSVNLNSSAVPAAITLSGPITTSSGTITLNSGTATTTLDKDITTSGANITFSSPVSVTSSLTVTTGATSPGDVSFGDLLTLSHDITVVAGSGNVTFTKQVNVGTLNLIVSSATTISSGASSAGDGITGTTGNVTLTGGTVNLDGHSGNDVIHLAGGSATVNATTISVNRNIDITSGTVALNGATTGSSTFTAATTTGGNVTFGGTFALGANVAITTGAGAATFTGAVALGASHNLDVISAGITTITGGITGSGTSAITIGGSTVNVDGAINLSAGTGTASLTNAVISGVNITTAGAITFVTDAKVDSGSSTVTSGATAVTFPGTLELTGGNLSINAGANTVTFTGAVDVGAKNLTVSASTTTTVTAGITGTSGSVSLTGATLTLNGSAANTINLSGAGNVALTGTTAIDVNKSILTAGGNVSFTGDTTTGASGSAITTSGTGNVLFGGSGALTLGGALTVTGSNVTFTGAATLAGHNLTVNAGGTTTVTAGITSTGAPTIDIESATNTIVNAAITTAGAGTIIVKKGSINADLTSAAGTIYLTDLTTIASAGGRAISAGAAGTVKFDNTNTITTGGALTITGLVKLFGDVTIIGGQAATDDITLNQTLDGDLTGNNRNLTVSAGLGDFSVTGVVGGSGVLHNLTVSSAALANFTAAVTVGNSLTVASADTTTFGSTISTVDLSLSSDKIDLAGHVTGTGALVLEPKTASHDLAINGAASGTATVLDLTSTEISQLQAGFTSIRFGRTNESGHLTITNTFAYGAPLTLSSPAGSVTVSNLSVNSLVINSAGTIINGTAVTATAGYVTNNGPLGIATNVTITTVAGNGNISLNGTVDGSGGHNPLTLVAGAGDITVAGAVGATTAPGAITITSAHDVSFGSSIAADSVVQTAGGGNTTFPTNITTSSGAGVDLTTGTIHLTNNVAQVISALGGGSINFHSPVILEGTNHTTTLSNTLGGTITLGTIDSESGRLNSLTVGAGGIGNVVINGKLGGTTPLGNLTIGGAILLTNTPLSTITNSGNLSLAGTNVFLNSAINSGGSVAITGTTSLTNNSPVTAGTTVTLNSPVLGLAPAALISAGGAVSIVGDLVKIGGITNSSGNVTITGATSVTNSGNFNVSGVVAVSSPSVGIGGAITNVGATTLTSSNLVINAAISSGGALTLNGITSLTNNSPMTGGSTITVTSPLIGLGPNALVTGTSTGSVSITGASLVLHGGVTNGGDITLTGTTSLTNDATLTGHGTVALTSPTLSLSALSAVTNSGATTLIGTNVLIQAAITSGGALTLTGTTSITNNAPITGGSSVTISSPTIGLGGLATITNTGAVTLSGGVLVINGAVTSGGGDITETGTTSLTNAAPLNGGAVSLTSPALLIGSAAPITGTNDVTLTGTAVALASDVTTPGTFTISSTTANLGASRTLTADEITFSTPALGVSGSGILTLQPHEDAVAINIGGGEAANAQLDISSGDIASLAHGFTGIVIGRPTGSHAIAITGGTFLDSVTLYSEIGSGSIMLNGPLIVRNGGSVTFSNANAVVTTLASTITTDGGAVTFNKAAQIGTGVTIDTTDSGTVGAGAAITFNQTLDSVAGQANSLTLKAGTTGDVAFNNSVGNLAGGALEAVTINNAHNVANASIFNSGGLVQLTGAGTTTIGGNLTATGAIAVTNSAIALGKASGLTIDSGNNTIAFGGPVQLTEPSTIISSGSGNVSFASALDSQATEANSLTLKGTGTTTFSGKIGNTTPLGTLTTDVGGNTKLSTDTVNATTVNILDTLQINPGSGHVTTITVTNGAFNAINGTTPDTETLAISQNGSVTFGGAIGAGTRLSSLTTTGAGATILGGGSIAATNQVYGTAVTVSANNTLTGTTVTFSGTVDADSTNNSRGLTVNASALTTFTGAVGGTAKLASLVTDSAGTLTLNAGVKANNVTFNDPVTLANDVTIDGATTVNFNNTVDGAHVLTVNASGLTQFGGAVGGTTPLTSLATDSAGTVSLGANITTTAGQTYNDDAVISAPSVTLTGVGTPAIKFAGRLDADSPGNPRTLILASDTTFSKAVGSQALLSSITNQSTTTISGGSVAAVSQGYAGLVTLSADTTLSGTDVTLPSVAGASKSLTIAASGSTVLGSVSAVKDLTSTAEGTTTIGGTITTSGKQIFTDSVILNADTTLQTGVGGGTGAAADLTVGSVTGTGAGHALDLQGKGTTTLGGNMTNVTTLTVENTAPSASLTKINANSVITSGDQTYSSKVVLGADVTLTGANITLTNTINSDSAATARGLTINGSGVTTLSGTVGGAAKLASLTTGNTGTTALSGSVTAGNQTFGNAVTVAGAPTLTGTNVTFAGTLDGVTDNAGTLVINANGLTTFAGSVGATHPVGSITTDDAAGADSTEIDTAVFKAGTILFKDPVTLNANGVFTGSNVTFTSTLSGTNATPNVGASIIANGVTTFGSMVSNLLSVTTDAGGSTQIKGNIIVPTQSYGDDVVIAASPVTLTASGGTITFGGKIDGDTANSRVLNIDADLGTTFGGAIGNKSALGQLNVAAGDATTVFSSGASVIKAQTISLGDNVTVAAPTNTFTGTTVTFGGSLDGATTGQNVVINASGVTTFNGNLGLGPDGIAGTTDDSLGALTTDAPGSVTIGATSGQIVAGNILFNDAVNLMVDTTVQGSSSVTFGKGVFGHTDGSEALTVNSPSTIFNADAGTTSIGLKSLTTDAVGTNQVKGNVYTANGITFNDAVVLTGNSVMTGNSVIFGGTIDGAKTLTVNTTNGLTTTTFKGAVGGATPLTSLTTDASGTTIMQGNSIKATTQNYADAVTVEANVILTGATVTMTNGVDADLIPAFRQLEIDASGITSLGTVGGGVPLASLKTDTAGTTKLFGNVSATTANFLDPVVLNSDLTVAGTTVSFGQTVNSDTKTSARALTLNASGDTTLGGAIGNSASLASLTTDAGGKTAIKGNVTLTGDATFGDAVEVGGTTVVITAADATFSGTVDGDVANSRELDVNAPGTTTFTGAIGGTKALKALKTDTTTASAAGTTALNGGLVNATTQVYGDGGLTLGADTVLSGTDITFGTVDGGTHDLTVSATGTTTYKTAVSNVGNLTNSNGGTVVIGKTGGAAVTIATTGNQTYTGETVSLLQDATLSSSASGILTLGVVNGANKVLSLSSDGTTKLLGNIGGTTAATALKSVTTDTAGGTLQFGQTTGSGTITVRTTGAQTYDQTTINVKQNTSLVGVPAASLTIGATPTVDTGVTLLHP